jgi:hypothetical protein
MKNPVIVEADKYGNVIRQSSNPEYGYIILKQLVVTINDDGFVDDPKEFKTLISGKISNLKYLNYYDGKELPGNIIVVESTKPFNTKNPDKHLKINPKTGEILKDKNNQEIYRSTAWDSTGCKDNVLIPHVRSGYISHNIDTKPIENKVIEKVVINTKDVPKQTSLFNNIEDIFGKTEDDDKEIVGGGSTVILQDVVVESNDDVVDDFFDDSVDDSVDEIITDEDEVIDESVQQDVDEEEDIEEVYQEDESDEEEEEEEYLFEI